MERNIGTDSVLAALSDTLEEAATLDLHPTTLKSPPPRFDPPEPQVPGQPSRRYLEQRVVGRGGFGEVVEAFDQDLRRRVALKRLRPERHERVARLIEEAQITAQLDHPGIPAVHSLGVDEHGRPFFTMAYIEGMSLAELFERRPHDPELQESYPDERVLRLLAQVCYAMAFAHERGVLHRDLKPDNIMLGRFGEVRVMDWGIAKIQGRPERDAALAVETNPAVETTSNRPDTAQGAILGTPGYMSPEQARSRPLDARSDVYSLGAILYELLAGRPPVTGTTTIEVLMKTSRGELTPLAELAEVPPNLAAIVSCALALDPQERYDDAMALAEDIERHLLHRPVSALQGQDNLIRRSTRAYFSALPRSSRLRMVHIDIFGAGCTVFGMGIGVWLFQWLGGFHWVLMILGLLITAPFTYTLLRKERSDDTDLQRTLREGMTRSRPATGASSHPDNPSGASTP